MVEASVLAQNLESSFSISTPSCLWNSLRDENAACGLTALYDF